jgi:hypothetical protein
MKEKIHLLKPLTPECETRIEDNIFYIETKLDSAIPIESWEVEDIVNELLEAGFVCGVDFLVEY